MYNDKQINFPLVYIMTIPSNQNTTKAVVQSLNNTLYNQDIRPESENAPFDFNAVFLSNHFKEQREQRERMHKKNILDLFEKLTADEVAKIKKAEVNLKEEGIKEKNRIDAAESQLQNPRKKIILINQASVNLRITYCKG